MKKSILLTTLIVWSTIIIIYFISRFYQTQWNSTTSMPQKLWITHVGDKNLKRNDYVVFMFHDYRMQDAEDFEYVVKQIGAISGDTIVVKRNKSGISYILPDGSTYSVFATLLGNYFTPLTYKNLIIPKGCYFVHGQHNPTFDSRYKEFGLVCEGQIYGKTYPIF